MTDEPTTKARPSTPQESSTLSAPSSSIKLGDPKHRDIGDRDDESARKSGHSKSDSGPDEQEDHDGGEGYKGPRADATKTAPDKHVQGEHPKSSGQQSQQSKQGQQNQPSQKSAPMKSGESSGSECCGSSAESQAKPGSSSSKK